MSTLDEMIMYWMKKFNNDLSKHIHSDVIFFKGRIDNNMQKFFYSHTQKTYRKNKRLSIILHTDGGTVAPVEKTVEIIRSCYQYVDFIITDAAMSAGTIFCMSGDNIYMCPKSSLGPIDPQVLSARGDMYIPAMGYLEQLKKLIEKSKTNDISPAEVDILRRIDIGDVNMYEQARNLTITLLKQWLVKYKFKNWKVHSKKSDLRGQPVTLEEKKKRAEEIASTLGDNNIWHSHGRYISMETLKKKLKLKINDYSKSPDKRNKIEIYNDFCLDYAYKNSYHNFMHSNKGYEAWR